MANPTTPNRDLATLGGGCFWCLEAVYDEIEGVISVESGYAGGHKPNPTYEEVCTGRTGHAEVVQITFDPQVITFRDLLDIFFSIHDPTTPNRQGADVGPQYRSIILYHNDEQRRIAEETIAELNAAKIWNAPIVTEVKPFTEFWRAEEYHQKYFAKNPYQGYCMAVVAPKVMKARKQFANRLKAKR
ncbi:MAG: peptide-methionine (S)-S-oxide reductase MsrA [Roseiflexus sp.]|nr:peptide-methionine (S)-S-oxide reductase MsrA [Roseiflexus sp.]MCS7287593.1 peptide-methionine (S)-S-oxide reductase MsrA [Roseiflexus sp.]MDW8147697.1 peptide-methionine (S)-S-oxide reductase MsrA [Roseiflexaceae bacterium]MDW8234722.1 peptide-methionine (S)-S-oxide reductase MsrA [Roseiflexaceae bacterium]